MDLKFHGDYFWTRRSPRSIRDGPEESRGHHEGGGCALAPGRAALPRGRLGDPLTCSRRQNILYIPKLPEHNLDREFRRRKPLTTKNQSGPCSGTLPEGGSITGGHLHHPGALHDEEGVVHPRG